MPGKTIKLNSLEARKQLLVAESELNREQFIKEVQMLKQTVIQIKEQAHSIGTVVTSAAKVVSTLLTVRQLFSGRAKEGTGKSWVGALVKGAQICASLWGSRSR
jgi:hypothetical protein